MSILERCVQEGTDLIDEDKVKELAGVPKVEYVNKVISAVVEYNVNNTLTAIDLMIKDGKDLGNLLWEMIKYVKDILVYKTTGNLEIYKNNEIEQIKELANKCSKERLLKIIYDLSELENSIKWSSQKTIMLQVGIIKLCNKTEDFNMESFNARMLELEKGMKQISNGTVINNSLKNVENVSENSVKVEQNKIINKKQDVVTKVQTSVSGKQCIPCWNKVVTELKQNGKIMLYTNLINGKAIELNDMTVGIEFPGGMTAFGKAVLEKPENIAELGRIFSMEYGKPMQIKILDYASKIEKVDPIKEIQNCIDIPINIIDE